MKSLLDLSVEVLQSCGTRCGADPSRDISCVTRRCKDEGDSFLTITLPTFSEGFERALAEGSISASQFPSFGFRKHQRLPRFLGGFVEMVFDKFGVLKEEPSVEAIRSIRQICLAFKRVLLPCTRAREKRAERRFLDVEASLRNHVVDPTIRHAYRMVSRIVLGSILGRESLDSLYLELLPRHGPGTTAEHIRGNAKYAFTEWPQRLDRDFPYSEFGCASIRNSSNELYGHSLTMRPPRDELPVRVCFVPKTLKTPRVIAVEPVAVQYMQQAVGNMFRARIENPGSLTSGHINFISQDVNSELARTASIDGRYATIDLSDASDRVSCLHAHDTLCSVPVLRNWFFTLRSSRARLPSGKVISLRKYASMGSALCFPMEALVFFNAIVTCRILATGRRVTRKSVYTLSRDVYVYGDDLVVPANEAPVICEFLEAFGLKVNYNKTFFTGKFRESCGTDWYDGEDVKPVYFRHPISADRPSSEAIVSLVSTANQLYKAGLWSCCRRVRQYIERYTGSLPTVANDAQALGWNTFRNGSSSNGWDVRYQRHKLKALVPTSIKVRDHLEGDHALLKSLTVRNLFDSDHLERTVRYGNLALKRRWILV